MTISHSKRENQPFAVTFSSGLTDTSPKVKTVTLAKLADLIPTRQAETKDRLPMLKLARMDGGIAAANVAAFTGAMVDYDGTGGVTIADAADMLRLAGVAALLYSSPSSTPESPRWRALAPYSSEMAMEDHLAMTDRLNGALGGIIDDPASWEKHQRFYFGQARLRDESKGGGTAAPVEVHTVDGQPIDHLDGITPAQRPGGVRPKADADPYDLSALLWTPGGYSIEKICEALAAIPNEPEQPQEWGRYNSVLRAVWLETSGSEDGKEAFLAWAARAGDKFKHSRSLRDWKDNGPRKTGDGDFSTLVKLAAQHGNHVSLYSDRDFTDAFDLLGDDPKPPVLADVGTKIMCAKNGAIQPTLTNATIFLGRVDEKHSLGLRLNLMSGREEWRDGPINDADLALIRVLIERAGMHNVSGDLTTQAVRLLAKKHAFHPVRDWLTTLRHDARKRIDRWLVDYCGAEDTPLVRSIGRAFLIAMIARVMQPGCKHDHVLVLGGKQGIGKSTACGILGGEWFGDNLPGLHNKADDAARYLQGKWLVEISELAPARKAEAEDLKSFLSRSVDENRAPYARRKDSVPRQCVMIGTTNETAYLRDSSGNRRFWPIECGDKIDLDGLTRDREQLFAEALAAFEAGDQWHLSREMEALACEAQETAFESDPWEQPIRDWLDHGDDDFDNEAAQPRDRVTVSQVMGGALGIPVERRGGQHSKRITAILKRCGWKLKRSKSAREWERVR